MATPSANAFISSSVTSYVNVTIAVLFSTGGIDSIIIVFFDNDQTGISFMNSIKRKHPELIYTWIPRKYRAKDISDFYKKYQREETIKLIKNFILYLKNE